MLHVLRFSAGITNWVENKHFHFESISLWHCSAVAPPSFSLFTFFYIILRSFFYSTHLFPNLIVNLRFFFSRMREFRSFCHTSIAIVVWPRFWIYFSMLGNGSPSCVHFMFILKYDEDGGRFLVRVVFVPFFWKFPTIVGCFLRFLRFLSVWWYGEVAALLTGIISTGMVHYQGLNDKEFLLGHYLLFVFPLRICSCSLVACLSWCYTASTCLKASYDPRTSYISPIPAP